MLDTIIHMMPIEEVQSLSVMELANEYPLLVDDQEVDLIASIEANGIREPLILFKDPMADDALLDGRNRLASAIKVGLDEVPVRYFVGTIEEAEDLIIDLNEKRRHLLPVQRAYIADKHRAIVAKRAQARKFEGRNQYSESLPPAEGVTLERGETREILAKKHNAGKNAIDTVQKIRRVAEETMQDPDSDGEVMTPRAAKATAVLNKMQKGTITISDAVKNVFGEPGQEINAEDPIAKFRQQFNAADNKWHEAAAELLEGGRPEDVENVRLREANLHRKFGNIAPVEGLVDVEDIRDSYDATEAAASEHSQKVANSPSITVLQTKPCGCDFSGMRTCDVCE